MSGAAPAVASVLAALALHWAVLARFDLPQGADGEGGTGGEAVAALLAAPGDLAALIADWDRSPAPLPPPPTLTEAEADAAPVLPERDLMPSVAPPVAAIAVPNPDRMAAPALPPPDLPPPEAAPTPAMAPLPEATAPPPEPPSGASAPIAAPAPAPRPERQAAGAGQGASAGQNGAHGAGGNDAARQSALAAWGAEVRAAVERHQRMPAGSGAEGAVTLVLEVARTGGLNAVSISASSGIAALDLAAEAAVRAAAPFAPAPGTLSDPAYALRLTLRFTR